MVMVFSISVFLQKGKFFFISRIYCRSVKFLKSNGYQIKTNTYPP